MHLHRIKLMFIYLEADNAEVLEKHSSLFKNTFRKSEFKYWRNVALRVDCLLNIFIIVKRSKHNASECFFNEWPCDRYFHVRLLKHSRSFHHKLKPIMIKLDSINCTTQTRRNTRNIGEFQELNGNFMFWNHLKRILQWEKIFLIS